MIDSIWLIHQSFQKHCEIGRGLECLEGGRVKFWVTCCSGTRFVDVNWTRTKPKLAECNVKVPAFQVLGYFGNHQNQCSSTAVFVLACFGMILKRYENYPLTLLKPGACQQYEGLHCQSGAGGSKMVPDIHQRLSNDRVPPRKKTIISKCITSCDCLWLYLLFCVPSSHIIMVIEICRKASPPKRKQ